MFSRYNKLVYDIAVTTGFIYLSSLLLEYVKPGLISNTFDLNLVLNLFLIILIASLFLKVPNYKLPALARLAYGLWALLILGIFAKVGLGLTTDTNIYLVTITSTLGLFWLLAWYYLTKK